MPKAKILVLTSSYPKCEGDNSGVFVEELSKRLTDTFEVFVLTPYSKGSQKEEHRNGISIIRYKYWPGGKLFSDGEIMANLKKNKFFIFQILPFLVSQLICINRLIRKEKISIIHAHWLIPQGFISVVYKTFINKNVKIVSTIHGGDINSFNTAVGERLKKYILKKIDILTVVSNAIKEKVIQLEYSKEIFVYPMGVDTVRFSPDKKDESIRTRYQINGSFLLFVGGLIERKGIKYLIQSMHSVVKEFSDVKLVVVGEGILRDEMIDLSKEIGIEDNIIFIGLIPHIELPSFFATADLFILPSISEGFGLVVAEAISCGTIAIASDLPCIHDIIPYNKTEFFFENRQVGTISSKIINILKSINEYNSYKIKARKYIVDHFEWENVKNNYLSLYHKLLFC